jgi:hypothetical protein
MKRIKSITSFITLTSSLFFASGAYAAANLPLNPGAGTTTVNVPRYDATVISNERVGVTSGNPKTIKFKLHEITAAAGFSLVFSTASTDTPATVVVTYIASGTEYSGCSFSVRSYTCTLPANPDISDVSLTVSYGNNASNSNYATYSTSYLQACNASTGRYCGSQIAYANKSVTFGPTTEDAVAGGTYQGNVELFPVSTGDMAKLHVVSTKSIAASNPPTLRVKGTLAGVEVEIGRRFDCVQGATDKIWDCEIPQYDAIPDVTGYSNVYLSLASARTGNLAMFSFSNLTQNKNVLSCTAP